MARRKNAHFEYHRERYADLKEAYRKALADRECDTLKKIMLRTVKSPARRFYVSEERAAFVIAAMKRGVAFKKMGRQRKRMFEEIRRRVDKMLSENRSTTIRNAVSKVISRQAPEFYLTPYSAYVILHRYDKEYHHRKP